MSSERMQPVAAVLELIAFRLLLPGCSAVDAPQHVAHLKSRRAPLWRRRCERLQC
jgi:hypothetical protein